MHSILAAATLPTIPACRPAEARAIRVGVGKHVHVSFFISALRLARSREPDFPSATPPANTITAGSTMRMKFMHPTARKWHISLTTPSAVSSPLSASSKTCLHVRGPSCLERLVAVPHSLHLSIASFANPTTPVALQYCSMQPRCPQGHGFPPWHTMWCPPSIVPVAPDTRFPPRIRPAPTPVPRVRSTRSLTGSFFALFFLFVSFFLDSEGCPALPLLLLLAPFPSCAAPTHNSAHVAASASLTSTTGRSLLSSSRTISARGTSFHPGKLAA
mmetsp:Transcript_18647/g.29637  ORF Transcript_18647/g.29637 Transcript_18647/m.29637 type:complete len:273 (+) Transcript_18647:246-1064(+)